MQKIEEDTTGSLEGDQKLLPSSASAPTITRKAHLKTTILTVAITAIFVLLLSLGLVAGGFLIGRSSNTANKNLETQRQTVVQEGDVIANVSQKVGKSVVSIVTNQQQSTSDGLTQYLGGSQTTQAAGTGLIIDSSGLILTNKHVVPDGTTNIEVVTSDGTTYDNVQIIGRDPLNDLAILRVTNAKNFTAATLGDSDSVKTGEKVIAIGNALGQFQNTVTSGIISGMGRPISAGDETGTSSEQLTDLFQTDAAINPGNSGGPLVDFNGDVIGLNTAVAQDAQNIGFSIPINEAKGVIESVKATGKISRPYIGVHYISLTPDVAKQLNLSVSKGAYVSTDSGSVVSGSPAQKSGIEPGDIIIKVNDVELGTTTSLSGAISRFKVGDAVTLTVLRNNKQITIKLVLAEAPTQ